MHIGFYGISQGTVMFQTPQHMQGDDLPKYYAVLTKPININCFVLIRTLY